MIITCNLSLFLIKKCSKEWKSWELEGTRSSALTGPDDDIQ